jgi:hypothetical protein
MTKAILAIIYVTTLALGSWPRQGFARVWAKRETRERGRVWEWTFTLPNELPCWELESQWTPESSNSDCKGQNPSPWRVIYIIEKLLKWRCLKWARMTHLDILNTSYGQKKGWESNWQFDSRPQKFGNQPNVPFRVGGMQHSVGKLLTRATTSLQTSSRSKVYTQEVIVLQSCESSNLGDFRTPILGVLGQKAIWMRAPQRGAKYTIWGRWWLPPSPSRGESCESEVARGSS